MTSKRPARTQVQLEHRERAVEIIRLLPHANAADLIASALAEAEQSALSSAQGKGWVACTTAQPKLAGVYLAHHDEYGYDVIPWTGASWGRQRAWDFESPHRWMPLPPPPKPEGSNG